MRSLSQIISTVFHPMFVLSYALLLILLVNPYLFAVSDEKVLGLLVFSVVSLSLLFPLLATLMMKGLGLIQSLEMQDKKERSILGQPYLLQTNIVLLAITIIAGLVGTARLILSAHRPSEVYGGYFIGIVSMLIAYRIVVL